MMKVGEIFAHGSLSIRKLQIIWLLSS